MRLVLIEGNHVSLIENKQKTIVVHVDHWDFDAATFIEDFRVRGEAALA